MANPYDKIVPGSTFVLTFGYSGAWTGGPLLGDIRSALASWAPFSTAKLVLLDVLSGIKGSIIITIKAQGGADVFTFGGIGSAIADRINSMLPGWNVVLTGLNTIGQAPIPGAGTTTTWQQFQQAGGFTLNPFADVTPQAGPSWIPFALLGGAALVVALIARR